MKQKFNFAAGTMVIGVALYLSGAFWLSNVFVYGIGAGFCFSAFQQFLVIKNDRKKVKNKFDTESKALPPIQKTTLNASR